MIHRAAIVAEARSWLGTPYQHQARLKGAAVDCIGLVIGVARAVGAVAPDFDFNGYSRQPDGVSLLRECDLLMAGRVEEGAMRPGDVIVTRYAKDPCHFGILTDYPAGGLAVVHALGSRDGRGAVIEHRLSQASAHRFVTAYRLPGVA